ncbi:saccharopine dehydrogenase NADP-binding domain-containing protein [Natronococcus jeotgali]|uniref:Saccharopine dehydrogenase n=1 Tax=Natronococcus jeotgali DSM 18795 TaxID=1227498 RepID=L9XSM1_9EURY|nr:saccharopine dehydrogenase NADP-binding domain-containing protein [Natronococcus jeotgali]ELY64775.1 saccharopine dehydrogenase [Natronococcus jeotgali DSM 18795]
MGPLLIDGSYGYAGRPVAEDAIDRGLDPVLAGRDRDQLREQVAALEQPGRRFSLEDPDVVAAALEDVDCASNCAGPFSNTAEPLVEGCLRSGTEYVDIAGEIPVIESIQDRDDEATAVVETVLEAVDESERAAVVDQFEHYGFEDLLGGIDTDVTDRTPREQ